MTTKAGSRAVWSLMVLLVFAAGFGAAYAGTLMLR